MNAIDIEKINQLISRTDISGNDKVRWLTDFIDGREFEQQERMYSEEDLKSSWDSSEQNMRFTFSSSMYRNISFKQWFEKFKKE
jgi:hypothetical protein